MMMDKTAGILIIGNEILSGKVTDENSPYLSRELRSLGIDVKRLVVLPDHVEVIAQEIHAWAGAYDWLFACGGVGPTHDDVTIAGIAKGLGKKVIRHAALLALVREFYAPPITEAMLKLTEVPEGTELIQMADLRYPVLSVSNIFIFPGIPELLKKKFEAVKERFRSTPFCLKKVYVRSPEVKIAHHLTTVSRLYPDLGLGSYPTLSNPEYEVMLTLESKDPTYLDQAFLHLMSLLPQEIVVKIE